MKDYFAVGKAIESRLAETMGQDFDLICSPFTANDPNVLKKLAVSAHINQLPSSFENSTGNGERQTETQKWQVSLVFQSPQTVQEEAALREKAGALCLKLRQALQGFKPFDAECKPLRAVGNQFYLTDDCRFRIFAFTFTSVCVI
ncbi:Gp37 family protein [Simonsiella muelleri]|uniref:Uncharacterized protein n=1 Tax=Simonsiella muelleri ATCC 29453 TaxID=641147 RepID=V9HKZ2_9NEIS|nr:hypothetical protein [Simonsiella muelleri]AUX61663.1 hypothetical protein BWP33_07525 [Simonsiella muelleri ATCC 29453]EFG29929.1 hypothetical protein HMPREF9021_02248 [Simonsiella muelleri ATCC 29453]UBQ53734.1 Gp37 family protein [Simonsiella muelleri]